MPSGYYYNGKKHVTDNGFSNSDTDIAYAIQWAAERADILSCSWGGNSEMNAVMSAINNAITNGRNGKGCVVIASSGNDYPDENTINFPARMDGVIAVGAVDKYGLIQSYSQRGYALDLVAPSGKVNLQGDVVTTDRMNTLGYNPAETYGYDLVNTNYTQRFGGTSAACPQVAGVAALMLSVRPDLTESEVRTALQQTARDLGTAGFDPTYGYGLVDAYAAVSSVAPYILGDDSVYDHEVYAVGHLGENMSVVWSLSGNNASNFTLETDTPSLNKCRITRLDNAVFTSSMGLTLTAQVLYNGVAIDTLTKQLTAPYIDGPMVPCGHTVYSVVGRPDNSRVVWETNGHGLGYDVDPNGLLPEDTTAHVIIPGDGEEIHGMLTAKVVVGIDTVGVLSKYIDSSGGFSGTWYQAPTATDSTNAVPQGFAHMSSLGMVSGRMVYLVSDDFIGATITHSQNGVLVRNWSNSNGVISFSPLASFGDGLGMVTINGSYPNSCRHFRFFLTLPQQPLPPLLLSASPSDGACQFTISKEEGVNDSGDDRSGLPTTWLLTVIRSDTGETAYESMVSEKSKTVSTIGWRPGVYIATASAEGQYVSSKFVVSK